VYNKRAWLKLFISLIVIIIGCVVFYYTIGSDLPGIKKNKLSVSTMFGPSFYKDPMDIRPEVAQDMGVYRVPQRARQLFRSLVADHQAR
jgi:hypothetical protein